MVADSTNQNKRCELTVVGIDQALVNVGFCVNDVHLKRLTGMVFRETKLRGPQRLSSIKRRVMSHIETYNPSLVAIEGYSYESTNRLADLGEIGGVLRVELFERNIPILVVPPKTLKRFITGNGSASKEQVMQALRDRYKFHTTNDNVADAVALAKFAEVYKTNKSHFRSELETVQNFGKKKPSAKKYKKEFSI